MNLEDLFVTVKEIGDEYEARIAALKRERDKKVKDELGDVKSQLETFIKDKSVPLIVRFNLWCKAPDEIVGDLGMLPTFTNGDLRQKLFEAHEFNKLEKVDVRQILSDYIDQETGLFDGDAVYTEPEISTEEIEEIVEEFLAQNIGYFTFDW